MQSEIFYIAYLMLSFVLLPKTMLVAAFNLVLINLCVSCISCRTQVSSSGTEVVNIYRKEKKRKLEEVLSIDVHAPEESVYESNSD